MDLAQQSLYTNENMIKRSDVSGAQREADEVEEAGRTAGSWSPAPAEVAGPQTLPICGQKSYRSPWTESTGLPPRDKGARRSLLNLIRHCTNWQGNERHRISRRSPSIF